MSESVLILCVGPTLSPSNGMNECMTVSFEMRDTYIGYVFGFRLFGDGGMLEHRKISGVFVSYSRFRRKLRGTTGHCLLGTQRPQMLCVAAWVWFSLSTEFVGVSPKSGHAGHKLCR